MLLAAAVTLALLLSGCTRSSSNRAPRDVAGTSTAQVSATRGGTLTVGNISVTIPAGAVAGTATAHLRPAARPVLADPALSEQARSLLTPVGAALDLDLSGQQPLQPLTVTFALPALPDQAIVVGLTDHAGTVSSLTGAVNPVGNSYTAKIDHLSGIQFAFFTPAKLLDTFSAALRTALGVTGIAASKPSCFGHAAPAGAYGSVVVAGAAGPLWPCVSVDGPNVAVTVHSTDALPWRVRSTTGTYLGASETDSAAAVIQAIYDTLQTDRRSADGLILRQDQGQWVIPAQALPVRMDAVISEGAWLASAAVFAAVFVADVFTAGQDRDPTALPKAFAAAVADKAAGLDCLTGVARAVPDGAVPSVAQLVAIVQAAVGCAAPLGDVLFKNGLRGLATVVLDIISTGAAVVVGALEALLRQAIRKSTTSWTVRQMAAVVSPCTSQAVRADLPGHPQVDVQACHGDWAVADVCAGECLDAGKLLQLVAGRWQIRGAVLQDCQETLTDQGVPPAIALQFGYQVCH